MKEPDYREWRISRCCQCPFTSLRKGLHYCGTLEMFGVKTDIEEVKLMEVKRDSGESWKKFKTPKWCILLKGPLLIRHKKEDPT
jgi:hypothetical protein